ncbi:peptidylprolyl isomerase [Pseudobacteriovorax antillogorgiicola]|uniref:Parvulin-like peptidyl-prolyl isomerase n=1 Tax=Pseudobacteriovorax antillogorgiicola TaxID=1513793 RepID=A0A1Y6B460_9BACT|nr:peptidylprolyl isomerase [Pseudobacteriovorax antillogorgiicola]TCS59356.1 parvulin-like peptidyl-prolyl isomerase [Pseudobacteriovorax antillogorgiicola]SME89051.1 Parvulin-like peptidyl-prolyl isomerase [Pseudobacteriovorax antillogorgiicola]
MLKKYLYGSITILFFGFGVYFWKILNTGIYIPDSDDLSYDRFANNKNLLVVGDKAITYDDVEWEYNLLTQGLIDDSDLTSIPEVYNREEQLKALRERLVANLIERKLLFEFIEQDSDFNLSDPARYTDCVGDWQKTIDQNNEFFLAATDKERLKNRLCERDIILQYLNERIFAQVEVTDKEVADYYSANIKSFEFPKRVVIRQIVLASENEAKRVRHRVRVHNFERYAREMSITPEAENGGLLGPFAKGDMPRIFDVAFSMRRGEIRGILKSTYGFHIIKLEKKLPKSKLSLGEARPKIELELRKQKQEKEYQKWVELALSAVPVESPKPL